MARLTKRARRAVERENSIAISTFISEDLHLRVKAILVYNKANGLSPTTMADMALEALEQYLDAAEGGTLEPVKLTGEPSTKSLKVFVDKDLHTRAVALVKKNNDELSGPRSIAVLTSVALSLYVENTEELIEYYKEHPEHRDGFKLRGE